MSSATLLDRILAPGGLSVAFQPVYRHRPHGWQTYAFEALMRGPADTNLAEPSVLFEYVRRKHAEALVDRACIALALGAAREMELPARLGINVHASTLEQDTGFPQFLERAARAAEIDRSGIIVEIVEHSPTWSSERFQHALNGLRDIGVSIALDDVGLGHSNYRMILECRPDYFKVDRYLVNGSSRDLYRRAMLRSISDLAGRLGGYVVAEGVETQDDLSTVLAEGIEMVQGFLLSPPIDAADIGTIYPQRRISSA